MSKMKGPAIFLAQFASQEAPFNNLANITGWRIEGPWRWVTAIGIRMSVRHRDLSFAGSPRGGVRLDFKERVKFGPFHLPALYVGVEDLEGLGAALAARGIAGVDARARR